MSNALSEALVRAGKGARIRKGIIATTVPARVTIAGSSSVVTGRLSSYTMTAGDVVILLQDDTSTVILGKVVAP